MSSWGKLKKIVGQLRQAGQLSNAAGHGGNVGDSCGKQGKAGESLDKYGYRSN